MLIVSPLETEFRCRPEGQRWRFITQINRQRGQKKWVAMGFRTKKTLS